MVYIFSITACHFASVLLTCTAIQREGCRFNSRWCQWDFSLTHYFWPYYGPGVDLASNRNEYQEYFLGGKGGRCIGLKTLVPSCSSCLEIWEPQPPGTLRACLGLNRYCFTFYILTYLQQFSTKLRT